ncbi:MAG: hypothetical protein QM489_00350 [Candidatus Izemoplasma sp.]
MALPSPKKGLILETIQLPESGIQVKYHSMTADDAKVFVMLKDDVTFGDLLNNSINVLQNCTTGVDVNELTYIDLQYLFLKVRIASKGNVSELNYICRNKDKDGKECGTKIQHQLDLDTIEPKAVEKDRIKSVKIPNTDITVILKDIYVSDLQFLSDDNGRINPTNVLDAICLSIDQIVEGDGDDAVVHSEFTPKELHKFVGGCETKVIEEINKNFVNKSSKMEHQINLTCPKCKHTEHEILRGLINFF